MRTEFVCALLKGFRALALGDKARTRSEWRSGEWAPRNAQLNLLLFDTCRTIPTQRNTPVVVWSWVHSSSNECPKESSGILLVYGTAALWLCTERVGCWFEFGDQTGMDPEKRSSARFCTTARATDNVPHRSRVVSFPAPPERAPRLSQSGGVQNCRRRSTQQSLVVVVPLPPCNTSTARRCAVESDRPDARTLPSPRAFVPVY